MRALIDPRENRVCELAESEFPVAAPLFWVDATGAELPSVTQFVDGEFVDPAPPPASAPVQIKNPVEKLTAFLAANPDVAALLK